MAWHAILFLLQPGNESVLFIDMYVWYVIWLYIAYESQGIWKHGTDLVSSNNLVSTQEW